jgi:GNAT superfamily N-acetyltransferase
MERLARTRGTALAETRRVLAATYGCQPEDFRRDGVVFTPTTIRPGRLRFHIGAPHLGIATFGAGVVVTVGAGWERWARRLLGPLDRDEIFASPCLGRVERQVRRSGQILAGPQHRYVCADDLWRHVPLPEGVELELVCGQQEVAAVGDLGVEFPHALASTHRPERPDMVAAIARADGRVVGVAGAGADNDEMWQVGIGVTPALRGRGVAAALVSACTQAILRHGRVPYYSTAVSHLASQSVALRVGYVPAWTEAYVYVPRDQRGPLPEPRPD